MLKEKQSWLKKDNSFKTEQLNSYLKNCGSQNDQIYELRKDLINKESELKSANSQVT